MKQPKEVDQFISKMAARVVADFERIEAPLRAVHENVMRGFEPTRKVAEAMAREARKLEKLNEHVRKQFEPMREILKRADADMRRMNAIAQKAIKDSGIDFEAIARAIEQEKARIPAEMRILAEHGWFVQPQMAPRAQREISEMLAKNQTAEVEEALVKHFNEELDQIETRLCRNSPKRERLLRSAFASHRSGNFAASIPLMLAQADGLCRDYTGGQLFSGRQTMQARIKEVKSNLLMYFAALIEVTPIIANEKQRATKPVVFNRHAIMHGEELSYDTAANGARAVSLLVYIDWVLGELAKSRRGGKHGPISGS